MTSADSGSLENAIKLRESGNLVGSRELFDNMRARFEGNNDEKIKLETEYVIQLRLEAKVLLGDALKLGRKLIIDHASDPRVLRSVSNTLIDLDGFEAAVPILEKQTLLYPGNSLKTGETQAHLALALLRTGRVKQAESLIIQAVNNTKLNSAKESYAEVRISYALMVRSLIVLAQGHREQAMTYALEAHRYASGGNAVHRIAQVEELIHVLKTS